MTRRTGIAAIVYAINACISLALGLTYLLRDTFMPYHAAALGRPWDAIEPPLQALLLALMSVAGAGWIALGIATLALVAIPVRRGERWARGLVPALLLAFYGPVLLATLAVLEATPANPPWYGNAIACATTLAALVIDRPWRAR